MFLTKKEITGEYFSHTQTEEIFIDILKQFCVVFVF